MNKRFGEYVVFLRKNKLKIESSRQLAKKLNISAQYMCDIENGGRIPSAKLLQEMEMIFELSEEEKTKFYDLASLSYKSEKVPADIAKFIISNTEAKDAIRKMMSEYKKSGEVSLWKNIHT